MIGGQVFENANIQESHKCSSQELFIVMCNVNNKLLNKVVKGKIRMSVPVIHLFQLTEGYILQAHERIKVGKGSGCLMALAIQRHHGKQWELPKEDYQPMRIDPVTRNDTEPMMMDSVLIDEYSSE